MESSVINLSSTVSGKRVSAVQSIVTGASGRLGIAVCAKLLARGDSVDGTRYGGALPGPVNYLVFCHRYRGDDNWKEEYAANVEMTHEILSRAAWGKGDCAAVVVTSVLSQRVGDQGPSYHATKAAQEALVRCHAARGPVRVNAVAAGPFTGAGPVVTIDEVANVIEWLASPKSSGISGARIVVDNGAGLEW